jgi:hypothetical protein
MARSHVPELAYDDLDIQEGASASRLWKEVTLTNPEALERDKVYADYRTEVEHMVAYSEAVAHEICERIALGETVSSICKDAHMPAERTVWKWRQVRRKFDDNYSRARVDQMHSWANQIVHLADDAEGDFKITVPLGSPDLERIEEKGSVTFKYTRRHVTRAALMIETRKWLMARYSPDAFGQASKVYADIALQSKSDEEMIQDLRGALGEAGMSSEDFVELLRVDEAVH